MSESLNQTQSSSAPSAPPVDAFASIGFQAEKAAPSTNGVNGVHEENGDQQVVEEIESLCMNCHRNGTTRLLLTKIPYFREVIIMSFSCDHCGFQNNEIQSAGSIAPRGAHFILRLTEPADFARTVVKADTATVKFIELDIEVPAGRGQLTNIEGLLSNILDDLELGQEARREQQPDVHSKLADVIARGRAMLAGEAFPFRVSVDDPAGNSFITYSATDGAGKWEKREYVRTPEQNATLGLSGVPLPADPHAIDPGAILAQGRLNDNDELIPNEVYSFPASCPGCTHPCTTHMKMVDVPHFEQVIIMSTVCDACGYRSNDVHTGGEVQAKGKRITLEVRNPADLARDILKSSTCALECPELGLSVNAGTLGGRFTTVEGLLAQVRGDLHNQIFEADGDSTNGGGDSLSADERAKWASFFEGLDAAIKGEKDFTLVLSDPMASSYVQSLAEPDPQVTVEEYERTEEEEEDLGLRDMKVEGYGLDVAEKKDEGGGND